jgi:hypothetical protein
VALHAVLLSLVVYPPLIRWALPLDLSLRVRW